MHLRSLAISIALACGLLVILGLAFALSVPAYCGTLINLRQSRARALGSITA